MLVVGLLIEKLKGEGPRRSTAKKKKKKSFFAGYNNAGIISKAAGTFFFRTKKLMWLGLLPADSFLGVAMMIYNLTI